MTFYAFTDGAARGNPGEAGIGVIIKDSSGAVTAVLKRYLGKTTNNQAEYAALLTLLEYLNTNETLRCTTLVVHTDSELMARQVNGQYKVKDQGLKVMFEKVKLQLQKASFAWSIVHIPREKNKEADALANEAIDFKLT